MLDDGRPYDFGVLGAGLSGLALAHQLAQKGHRVAIIERMPQVGGLARTLSFGPYRYDLGGHRWHTPLTDIDAWVGDLMGDDLLDVPRRSRIRLDGRYVDYPLQFPGALSSFGVPKATRIVASYVAARVTRLADGEDVSFEDWIVHRFGRALYEIYFQPYTEKVWGMPCTQLSSDWASQRIQLPGLAAAILGSLAQKPKAPTLVSQFRYPRLGIGMITDRLAAETLATGNARLVVGACVVGLDRDEDAVHWRVGFDRDGRRETLEARQIISTIPVDALIRALPNSEELDAAGGQRLAYRSLICVCLALDAPRISADTWTYFPDRQLLLGRTHEPPNWSPYMAPEDSTSLCVEVFCSEGDAVWRWSHDDLVDKVVKELRDLELLGSRSVRDAWVAPVPYAYPIYHVGHQEALDGVLAGLRRWPDLHLAGRTGTFRYLNMDGVVAQALALADALSAAI
jgi:protoporphyrinogen oxidase